MPESSDIPPRVSRLRRSHEKPAVPEPSSETGGEVTPPKRPSRLRRSAPKPPSKLTEPARKLRLWTNVPRRGAAVSDAGTEPPTAGNIGEVKKESRPSKLRSSFKKLITTATAPTSATKMDSEPTAPLTPMEIPSPPSPGSTPTTEDVPTSTLSARALSSNKGGAGEDNHFYLPGSNDSPTMLAAFDGLGGHARGYGGQKGGRIASRAVATMGKDFFSKINGELTEKTITIFRDNVNDFLFNDAEANVRASKMRGTGSERLCTTACIASVSAPSKEDDSYTVDVAWMGDSRAYHLSPTIGLQQLTVDDAKTDAPLDSREAAIGGAPMKQYLSADMKDDWQFHLASHKFDEPGIVCSCTDGVFEYVPGPWEVEKIMLKSMQESKDAKEWSVSLTKEFSSFAGDDVTLLVEPVGFESFDELKAAYAGRYETLEIIYSPDDQSPEMHERLWQRYKDPYRQRMQGLEDSGKPSAGSDNKAAIESPTVAKHASAEEYPSAKENTEGYEYLARNIHPEDRHQ